MMSNDCFNLHSHARGEAPHFNSCLASLIESSLFPLSPFYFHQWQISSTSSLGDSGTRTAYKGEAKLIKFTDKLIQGWNEELFIHFFLSNNKQTERERERESQLVSFFKHDCRVIKSANGGGFLNSCTYNSSASKHDVNSRSWDQ